MEEKPLGPNCRVIRVKFQRTARLTPHTDQARRSMANLWNDMVRVHKHIRCAHWKWPSQKGFDAHFVRREARYPGLPSACIQQAVRKFFGNLATTRTNRKNGLKAKYPWRDRKHFATVLYRGNFVSWEKDRLTLGGGNGAAPIVIPMAENPGTILKAELRFDEVLVTVARAEPATCDTLAAPPEPPPSVPVTPEVETDGSTFAHHAASAPVTMAGDPGQRWAWTLLASTGQSLMVNGRALVSEKVHRAKQLGHLQAELSRKVKGSKRYRHLKRSIARLKAKSARRIRDANRKISRAVVDFGREAGATQMVLSQPHGIAQAPGRQAQRQRNGLWEYGEQSRMIAYKAQGKFEVLCDEERGTSSTCPKCHKHAKPSGRIYRCPRCGFVGHRDLVGAGNQLGRHDPHADVVMLIKAASPKCLRAFRPPKARSSVVETDGSSNRQELPPEASAQVAGREWPAGDHAGRATPARRDRQTSRLTSRGAGKNLGVCLARPRTSALLGLGSISKRYAVDNVMQAFGDMETGTVACAVILFD